MGKAICFPNPIGNNSRLTPLHSPIFNFMLPLVGLVYVKQSCHLDSLLDAQVHRPLKINGQQNVISHVTQIT